MRTKYFALIAGFVLCALLFAARGDTPPTDPQIAPIVVAANTVDIAGQLAKTKTKDAAVQTFAELMITDHTSANTQASDLVTKLGVKPEQSNASRGLSDNARR
jgi:predicted outer membrane protein